MKDHLNIKTTMIAGLLVAFALWFGYYRGYRQGERTERRAWESTAQLNTSMVELENNPKHLQHPRPIFYKNPHFGYVLAPSHEKPPVNVPDLRNTAVK
jgi:hypothetical protein